MTLDLRDMSDVSKMRFLAMLKRERTDVLNEADGVHEIEGGSDNEDHLRAYADILGDFIEQMER